MKQNSLTSSEYHVWALKITNKLTIFPRSQWTQWNVGGGRWTVIKIQSTKQSSLAQLIFCGLMESTVSYVAGKGIWEEFDILMH